MKIMTYVAENTCDSICITKRLLLTRECMCIAFVTLAGDKVETIPADHRWEIECWRAFCKPVTSLEWPGKGQTEGYVLIYQTNAFRGITSSNTTVG